MVLVIQDRPQGCSIDSNHFHRTDVVNCKLIAGGKRTPLIRVSFPPSTLEHLPYLEESLTNFRDQDTIVLGDLNADIG